MSVGVEERYGDEIYLNEYTEYDAIALKELLDTLEAQMDAATQAGYNNAFVQFTSTLDAYDGVLGPVEVTVRGYRPLNARELVEEAKEKEIANLAEELGVSHYEAAIVKRLKEAGKL